MVYRIYVEKKEELANEARELAGEARDFLGILSLEKVRILNRYDVENIDKELFDQAVHTVFSEPHSYGEGLSSVWKSICRRSGRNKKTCHQSGGEPGSLPGPC